MARRSRFVTAVVVVAVAGAGLVVSPAGAQEETVERRVVDIVRRQAGIIRRVESIKGEIRTESTPEKVAVTLAADVLFEFDKADLSPAASARIAEVARQIEAGAKGPVAVVGHTDSKGEPAYNDDLLRRRAASVRDALATSAPATYTVAGRGEAEPVAPNENDDGSDNTAGRALNRRVTITFARQT